MVESSFVCLLHELCPLLSVVTLSDCFDAVRRVKKQTSNGARRRKEFLSEPNINVMMMGRERNVTLALVSTV